jgi:hypothetical protein
VFLLPLPRFSRLPGMAAAVAVAAHITSRTSIAAAARASNMLGIEMAAAITVAVAAITVEEITAGATIKATTIKAADRGWRVAS